MPIKILMPALSPTMTEGNLIRWLKNEGDAVAPGDILAEIETDKATMEVESIDEGRLAKILVAAGTEGVQVNKPIAVLLEEDENESALEGLDLEDAASVPAPQAVREEVCVTTVTKEGEKPVLHAANQERPALAANESRIFASPLARRLAQQAGLDVGTIQGSGPHGRVVKADVEAAQHNAPAASSMQGAKQTALRQSGLPAFETVAISGMRKVIAQRLCESKQTVPHFYLTVECQIDKLLALRKEINNALSEDAKISINDMVIRACAVALMRVPEANASWAGDHIKQFHAADIAVAVAIEGGLVTPIIRDADQKSVVTISAEAKQLISKARAGKLTPEDYQGGTFSLSNLGMFGIDEFGAIINPPQGCILAVGAGKETVVVEKGNIQTATVMKCTLSVDHRVVDGAAGAKLLKELKEIIQNPILLLV